MIPVGTPPAVVCKVSVALSLVNALKVDVVWYFVTESSASPGLQQIVADTTT